MSEEHQALIYDTKMSIMRFQKEGLTPACSVAASLLAVNH